MFVFLQRKYIVYFMKLTLTQLFIMLSNQWRSIWCDSWTRVRITVFLPHSSCNRSARRASMLRITHHTPQPKTQQRCSYAGSGYVLVGGRGVDEAEGIIKREVKRGGRVLASPKSITRDCGAEKVPCPISCFISKWKCDYRETLPGNITSSPITYSYQE